MQLLKYILLKFVVSDVVSLTLLRYPITDAVLKYAGSDAVLRR